MLKSLSLFTFALFACHLSYSQDLSSNADAVKEIMNRCSSLVKEDDNDIYNYQLATHLNGNLHCSSNTEPETVSKEELEKFEELVDDFSNKETRSKLANKVKEYALLEAALSLWVLNKKFFKFDKKSAVFEICKLKACTDREVLLLKDLLKRSSHYIDSIESTDKQSVLRVLHKDLNPTFKRVKKECAKLHAAGKALEIKFSCKKGENIEHDVKFAWAEAYIGSRDRYSEFIKQSGAEFAELIESVEMSSLKMPEDFKRLDVADAERVCLDRADKKHDLLENFLGLTKQKMEKDYRNILKSPIRGVFILDSLRDSVMEPTISSIRDKCLSEHKSSFYQQLKGPEIILALTDLQNNIKEQVVFNMGTPSNKRKFIETSLISNPRAAINLLKNEPDEELAKQVCSEIRRINKKDYIKEKGIEVTIATLSLLGTVLSVASVGTSAVAAEVMIGATLLYGAKLEMDRRRLLANKEALMNSTSTEANFSEVELESLMPAINKLNKLEKELDKNKRLQEMYVVLNSIDLLAGGWTNLYKFAHSKNLVAEVHNLKQQEKQVKLFARNMKKAAVFLDKILSGDRASELSAIRDTLMEQTDVLEQSEINKGKAVYGIMSQLIVITKEIIKLQKEKPGLKDEDLYAKLKQSFIQSEIYRQKQKEKESLDIKSFEYKKSYDYDPNKKSLRQRTRENKNGLLQIKNYRDIRINKD